MQVLNRNRGFPRASAAQAADACPGILDLHEARDGLVARIRLPGGYVSAARLRRLAALASRFGDAHVDLTARGNVQIRGVAPGLAADLAQRAVAAGFLPSPAHDRARNILASPLTGLAGRPGLRAAVRRLDRAIRADPDLAALPGRFLFSLDDGTGRAGLGTCDVGLRWCCPRGDDPRARSGETELIVAGRHTGLHAPAGRGIGHALTAARAFLRQRGAAAGRMTSRVAGLPDGGARIAAQAGGLLGGPVADVTDRLAPGPVPGDATLAVAAAPLARLTAAQVRLVAALVRPGDVARLAAAGRIVLPLAGPAAAALDRLADAGLITGDDHDLAAVTACAGMTCGRSLADVRSAATRLSGLAAVHWAGCDRRCGLPADAVAVVATPGGGFTLADGTAVVTAPGGGFATEGNPPGVTGVTARSA